MNSNNGSRKLIDLGTPNQGEQEIKRYLKILVRRKWLILLTFLGVFAVWMVYLLMFGGGSPKYTANALVTFQNPQSVSAVAMKGGGSYLDESLITSNKLLGQVVDTLQLNLGIVTENLRREDVFSYVEVSAKSKPGDYKIIRTNNKYKLYYSYEDFGIKERKLLTFAPTDTVSINEMTFVVNDDSLKQNMPKNEVQFRVKRFESAIQFLKSMVSYKSKRRGPIVVWATSGSPWYSARIVNIVVDKFVDLSLELKRYHSSEELKVLEHELSVAKSGLETANDRLKNFREKYPWVVLTPTTTTQIDLITDFGKQKGSIEDKIGDFKKLIQRLESTSDIDQKITATNELLTYLNPEGITIVSAFQAQFGNLIGQRNNLLNTYAPTHPFVAENEEEINNLISKIIGTTQNHIHQLQTQIGELEQNTNTEKYKLRNLPSKEIELAEIVRDRDMKTDLYNNIISRLNRAKIEHEVEVSDVLVIDKAVPPPLISPMANYVKKFIMGLVLALGCGLGLAIVIEFFNKTVENPRDLQEKLKLPVIGSVPLIANEDKNSGDIELIKGKKDPKLITLDYSPTPESESYRDLRTKILYKIRNQQLSSFLISSLRPGEGKSLTSSNIAITLAQQKISTILIDADLRRGVLHNTFTNKKKPGLSDFLISKATVDYNNISKLIQTTFVPNLFIISSGTPVPNPSELLGSERMKSVMDVLKSRFGIVILDTPPFQASTDAVIASTLIDFVLVVVRSGSTNIEQLEHKINEYPFLKDKIGGVILNMIKADPKKYQYNYSYYHY